MRPYLLPSDDGNEWEAKVLSPYSILAPLTDITLLYSCLYLDHSLGFTYHSYYSLDWVLSYSL